MVIRITSSFRETDNRLYLARSNEDILVPEVIDSLDLLLIDERMAEIDTWNITKRIRERIGKSRQIAILALVKSLDANLISRGRELGVDAFLLKSQLGDELVKRVDLVSMRVPVREAFDPQSVFLPHDEFVVDLREAIEILESVTINEISDFATSEEITRTGPGVGLTVSWKPGKDPTRRRSATTRFKRALDLGATKGQPSHAADFDSLTGRTFGKVHLLEELGRGGGGTVFKGRHTSLDMPVAIKILYPDLVQKDPKFADRFLAEARTSARITNGAVVRVLDCDRDSETGCYYIVMELIDGQPLDEMIKQGGGLQEGRLVEIAVPVARVLMAAEALGIVHRDVKPANILLTADDEVKVADLGLAKSVERVQGIATGRLRDARISRNLGKVVGTPYYIAPEQIEGKDDIDSRLDIYSLGATLYHAATGSPPFEATSSSDLFYHHLNTPAPALNMKRPDYSRQFSSIVQRMMAKEPSDRFSSCRELHGVLRDHRDWLVTTGATGQGIVGKLRRTFRLQR